MPSTILLFNSSFLLLKYLIWFVFGVITFQWKLIRLHGEALFTFLSKDLQIALRNRRLFHNHFQNQIVYQKSLIKPARFFVLTDVRRIVFKLFPE